VTEPVVINPVMMQDAGDCGVACLRMITGLTYAQVIAVFGNWKNNVMANGMSRRQLLHAAKRLGFPLRFINTDEPGRMVGIIDLRRQPKPDEDPDEHLAVIANGCLYNPAEGMLWTDIDAFLKTRNWKVLGVYVRQQTKGDTTEQ
jgi:hypothetical protein